MLRIHRLWIIYLVVAALILSTLACNIPDGIDEEDPSAVESVYGTITAQAESSPVPTDIPTDAPTGSPTPTETPTVSPTPPEERTGNGDNFSITRCSKTVTIDGDRSDWDDLDRVSPISLNTNTYGESQWGGTDDLSGNFRSCWIDSNLYFFVEVRDDIHVQNQTGQTAWLGDEVELLFDGDLNDDYYDDIWNADDRQFGLSPGDFGDSISDAVQYHPRFDGSVKIEVAARRAIGTGGNYTLEAAIPWLVLGIVPRIGDKFGFCLALSDNDQVGQARQDSMVGHCENLIVTDPTTWITITLEP